MPALGETSRRYFPVKANTSACARWPRRVFLCANQKECLMRWVKLEMAEHKMDRIGVRWKFKQIKWVSIDGGKSKRNNARIIGSSVIDDLVLKYALMMEEDPQAVFPAMLVYKDSKSYVIIDGNHRFQAYDLADIDKPILMDCYVVETDDPKKLELLIRSFNTLNGMPQKKEESITHVMHLIDKWPALTSKELCDAFGLKPEQVSKGRKIYDTNNRLVRLGVPSHGLKQGHLEQLSRLKNDNVMKRVAQAAYEREMTVEQITETVVAVNGKRTEKDQIEAVAGAVAYVPLPKNNQPHHSTTKIRDRLNRQMTSLLATLNSHMTLESLQLTADQDIKQVLYRWETLQSRAKEILYARRKNNATVSAGRTGKKRPAKSRK